MPSKKTGSAAIDTRVPKFKRFHWPKQLPALDAEQTRINDDFVRHWHEVLPKKYNVIEEFNHTYPTRILPDLPKFRTLELGAGIGGHIPFETLDNQEYHCIELRPNMAEAIEKRFPAVKTVVGDCQRHLPFDDSYFDRIVVIHVLEHLPDLPAAMREVRRVLKPGGLFSVVLPCDPGLAYELARKISAERIFRKRYGLPYRWLIRREHINSPAEILSLLRKGFEEVDRTYFPLRVPLVNANLCIGVTLRRTRPADRQEVA
ncbi:MAG: Methyltransferase 24 [Xanthobacteraceae bacterium]|jgi:SAM-dependent methyltransferase|nr:Methyltransferase 24 [Xanthobacteraceae bacterium]